MASFAGTAVNDLNAALPYVHAASGGAAFFASICAVVTSETIIGSVTCGGIALVASGVNEASSIALEAEGRESPEVLALDSAGLASGGIGYVFEVAGKSAEAASESASALSELWRTTTSEARWTAKLGPAIKTAWYGAKASTWHSMAQVLSAIGRALSASSVGTAVGSTVAGGNPGNRPPSSNNCYGNS